jgi:hypothetical protein
MGASGWKSCNGVGDEVNPKKNAMMKSVMPKAIRKMTDFRGISKFCLLLSKMARATRATTISPTPAG